MLSDTISMFKYVRITHVVHLKLCQDFQYNLMHVRTVCARPPPALERAWDEAIPYLAAHGHLPVLKLMSIIGSVDRFSHNIVEGSR